MTETTINGESFSEETIPEASLVDAPLEGCVDDAALEASLFNASVSRSPDQEVSYSATLDKSSPVNISIEKEMRVNIMVSGLSGSGKSTFCRQLLRRYFTNFTIKDFDGSTMQILERGRGEKNQGSTKLIVTVVDTPGFGDTMNNNDRFDPVLQYILKQNETYEREEIYRDPNKQGGDTRIHCLFYFLSPSRVTQLDCEFMRRLQSNSALVPIVSKADTMTIEERAKYLREIHVKLEETDITLFEFNETNIDTSWLEQPNFDSVAFSRVGMALYNNTTENATDAADTDEASDLTSEELPQIPNVFAVISGTRRYMYGTASEDNPRHSDTPRLHRVLFREGSLGRLLIRTNEIHNEWRLKKKKKKILKSTLYLVKVSCVLLCVIFVTSLLQFIGLVDYDMMMGNMTPVCQLWRTFKC